MASAASLSDGTGEERVGKEVAPKPFVLKMLVGAYLWRRGAIN